jgi:hypothetical protein
VAHPLHGLIRRGHLTLASVRRMRPLRCASCSTERSPLLLAQVESALMEMPAEPISLMTDSGT